MKLVNSNTAMFSGFLISFVAIIFNALVLADIGNRVGNVDAESKHLTELLREQTLNSNESEAKFQDYQVMSQIAATVPPAKRNDALATASLMLDEAFAFLFVASNDVSITEVRRIYAEASASEASVAYYEGLKKALNNPKPAASKVVEKKVSEAEIKSQKEEVDKAIEAATRELENDENDLRKKLAAISVISNGVANSKSSEEFYVRIFPVNKLLSAKMVESVKQKQTRLAELEADKSRLIKYQGYSTFAALALQMLGLMFVFLKDVLKIKESAD